MDCPTWSCCSVVAPNGPGTPSLLWNIYRGKGVHVRRDLSEIKSALTQIWG
jgi:hypothetical protein